jgi:hypothetical protein
MARVSRVVECFFVCVRTHELWGAHVILGLDVGASLHEALGHIRLPVERRLVQRSRSLCGDGAVSKSAGRCGAWRETTSGGGGAPARVRVCDKEPGKCLC